jgi:CheY-like chemotaxis protein
MEASRLRVATAFLAVIAFAAGVCAAAPAWAQGEALQEALDAYEAGNADEGLEKLRAYVEGSPEPAEVEEVLRGTDQGLLGRVLSMGGEHERLMRYLVVRARPAVEESPDADPSDIAALVEQAVTSESIDQRRRAGMRLRVFGELAVPQLYPHLAASEPETVVNAQFAFLYLGEDATLPLTTVLRSDDERVRRFAVDVLGDLGDRRALPALLRVVQVEQDPTIRDKASAAVQKIAGGRVPPNAPTAYVALGERFYSNDPTVVAGLEQTRNLWTWEEGELARYEVPAYLYPYLMAEDLAYRALEVAPDYAAARGLLVRALLAQKVEADVIRQAGGEPPEVLGGALNLAASQGFAAASEALRASLQSRDWDVAVEAAGLVARTYGGENLQGHPLGDAVIAPEKRVRYAAAIAALEMSPPRGLPNSDKVAALAAQAASESAVRQVLVIDDRDETRSRIVMDLAHAGYVVSGEASGYDAVARAKTAPTLDVILVRADLGDPSRTPDFQRHVSSLQVIDELLADVRTRDMRIVLLVESTPEQETEAVQEFFQNKYGDGIKGFVQVPLVTANVVETVGAAAEAGDLSPDQERANALAARAADAFAVTDFTCLTFDLQVAVEPLSTAATEGPTPEIRLNAVRALGNVRKGGVEALTTALREGETDEIKAAAATSLGQVLAVQPATRQAAEALVEASAGEGPVAEAALRALGTVRSLTPAWRLKIYKDHRLQVGEKAGSSP